MNQHTTILHLDSITTTKTVAAETWSNHPSAELSPNNEKFATWKSLCDHIKRIMISWNLLDYNWSLTNNFSDKMQLNIMCFVLSWCTKFLDKSMALWLSQCTVITSSCIFSSSSMPSSHIFFHSFCKSNILSFNGW